MELEELLEREGHDADDLLAWAQLRAETLLAELDASDELARLLESGVQINLEVVAARPVAVAQDLLPTPPKKIEAQPPAPARSEDDEGTRARRRVPSTPQPQSAAELPPPPEHSRLAEGEPEPVLEHVDTGPIDLGTPEADALISASSTRTSEPPSEEAEDPDDFEIEQLEELDDEELEIVEVEDEPEDEPDAPPPPPPPPRRPPPSEAKAPAPPPPEKESVDIDGLLAELKER